uniref:Checkpoint protein n=1 Tax=Dermatophagoides pteronyssinus TaxID=6956 RepID=A0A6P6XL54_DERPT|nr:uncharacterized protein LOC113788871 [Dermatophagoides pteronyssinus]
MKFRVITRRYEAINTIKRSIMATAKLSNSLIFRIDSDSIQLIPDTLTPMNPISIRCILNRSLLFDNYSFKGLNDDNNFIYFYVRSDSIINIINTIHLNIRLMKIKLTTNNQQKPVLRFTTENPSADETEHQTINNQLFISVINQQSWSLYDDEYSSMNQAQISLNLPTFKLFANDIAKLNDCSNFIRISAKMYQNNDDDENILKAKLTMTSIIDSLQLSCRYDKLSITNGYSTTTTTDQSNQSNKVFVDIRKLNELISYISILQPTDGICEIHNNHSIRLQFFVHLVNFKIILPHYDLEKI